MLKKLEPTIALIDSGMGGISVLRQLIDKKLCNNYIYFADNLYMPYGKRSHAFLKKRVESIIQMLNEKYCVDLIVVACNTASSVIDTTKFNNVITMRFDKRKTHLATPLTKQMNPDVNIISDSTLARIIEKNFLSSGDINKRIKQHIKKLKLEDLDELVLGCTHYELVANEFKQALPATKIINNSEQLINKIKLKAETNTPTILVLTSRQSKKYKDTIYRLIAKGK